MPVSSGVAALHAHNCSAAAVRATPQALYAKGFAHFEDGDFGRAAPWLQRAFALNPWYVARRQRAARTHTQRVCTAARRACVLGGRHVSTACFLGAALGALDRFAEALDPLRKVRHPLTPTHPHRPRPRVQCVRIREMSRMAPERLGDARINVAMALHLSGADPRAALAEYEEALRLFPAAPRRAAVEQDMAQLRARIRQQHPPPQPQPQRRRQRRARRRRRRPAGAAQN